MNENLLNLHKALLAAKWDVPTDYNEFQGLLKDPNVRSSLFKNLQAEKWDIPNDPIEFDKLLGYTVQTEAASPDVNESLRLAKLQTIAAATPLAGGLLQVPVVGDLALSAASGAVDVYKGVKGLTGITSLGFVPKGLDMLEEAAFGGTANDLQKELQTLKSPELQKQEEAVQNAEGFGGTIEAYIDNPYAILSGIAETAPLMVGGAGIASGSLKLATALGGKTAQFAATKLGQAVAAGLGEGLLTAGTSAEGIREQTDNHLLTGKQAGLAAASGVLTGVFGALGNRIAAKFSVDDLDLLFQATKKGTDKLSKEAQLTLGEATVKKLGQIFGGAISEGTLEELPQSLQEQALQNIALGKDWKDGLGEAAASGWILGTVMGAAGGVTSPIGSSKFNRNDRDQKIDQDTALEDLELQNEIDNIINPGASLIAKALDKLEDATNLQITDRIKAAQDAVIEAKLAQQKAETELRESQLKEDRLRTANELLARFEASPTVPFTVLDETEAEMEDPMKLPALAQKITEQGNAPVITPTDATTTTQAPSAPAQPMKLTVYKAANPEIKLYPTKDAGVSFATGDKEYAEQLAGKQSKNEKVRNSGTVTEYQVELQNPKIVNDPDSEEAESYRKITAEQKSELEAQGYDSIILKDEFGNNSEIIIFDRTKLPKTTKQPVKDEVNASIAAAASKGLKAAKVEPIAEPILTDKGDTIELAYTLLDEKQQEYTLTISGKKTKDGLMSQKIKVTSTKQPESLEGYHYTNYTGDLKPSDTETGSISLLSQEHPEYQSRFGARKVKLKLKSTAKQAPKGLEISKKDAIQNAFYGDAAQAVAQELIKADSRLSEHIPKNVQFIAANNNGGIDFKSQSGTASFTLEPDMFNALLAPTKPILQKILNNNAVKGLDYDYSVTIGADGHQEIQVYTDNAFTVVSDSLVDQKSKYQENLETMGVEALTEEIKNLEKQEQNDLTKAKLKLAQAEVKIRNKKIAAKDKDALKLAEEKLQKQEAVAVRLSDSVVKIARVKKQASLKRLEKVVDDATNLYKQTQYEPYLEVAQKAEAAHKNLVTELNKRKEAALESKEKKAEQAKNVKTKEERLQEKEEKKQKKEEKKAAAPANKDVTVKGYAGVPGLEKEQTGKLGAIKDRFYLEIAKAVNLELGKKVINDRVNAYLDFRKSNNLPMEINGQPLTADYVIKRATSEAVLSRTKKDDKKQKDKAAKELAEASRRMMTVEEYQKFQQEEEKKLKKEKDAEIKRIQEEIKAEMAKQSGLDPSAFEDFDFMSGQERGTPGLNALRTALPSLYRNTNSRTEVFDPSRLFHIKNNDLSGRLQSLPKDKRSQLIGRTIEQLEKRLARRGKQLAIFVYDTADKTNTAGMYFQGRDMDIVWLSSGVFNPQISDDYTYGTILHELTHGHTNLLANVLYRNVPSFAKEINKTYDSAKLKTIKLLNKFFLDQLELAKELGASYKFNSNSVDPNSQVGYLYNYITGFLGKNFKKRSVIQRLVREVAAGTKPISALNQATDLLLASAYGLTNQQEFLSEATSSSTFGAFLHSMPSSRDFDVVQNGKSILRDIMRSIRDAVESFVGRQEAKSVFDEVEFLLTTYDQVEDMVPSDSRFDVSFFVPTINDFMRKGLTREQAIQQQKAKAISIIEDYYGSTLADYEPVPVDKLVSEGFSREVAIRINKKFLDMRAKELAAMKPSTADPNKTAQKKIVRGVARLLEPVAAITSEKEVKLYIDRMNKKLPETKRLGEAYNKLIWRQIKRNRKSLAKDIALKDTYLKQLTAAPEYLDKTSKYHHDVEDFASVDLKKLNKNQRHTLLVNGFGALLQNKIISKQAYNILLNSRVTDVIASLNKNRDKIDKGWFTRQAVAWTNPMTALTALAKYNKNVAEELMNKLYSKLMWAYTQSGVKSDAFWQSLSAHAEKTGMLHKNLVKVGVYGGIFSTETDPANKDMWEQEVRLNAENAVRNAKNKMKAYEQDTYTGDLNKKQIQNEIDMAVEVYNKIEQLYDQNKLSLDGILDKKETEFYNMVRAFADKHEMEFFRNAVAVWDQEPPKRFNYFPTLAQGRIDKGNVKDYHKDELIRSGADNVFDALTPTGDKGGYDQVFGKKVGSTYKRFNPNNGYYYEVDALAIGKRWSKNLLFDIYASSELKIANNIMRDKTTASILGLKLRDSIVQQLRVSAGAGMRYDPAVGKFLKTLLKGRDALYTATMLNVTQSVLQTAPGIAAASVISANINPLTAGKTFGKAMQAASMAFDKNSKFYKLLETQGLGIQLRDAKYERFLSPDDYRNKPFQGKWDKFAETASELAITSADKFAARLVWFAAYFDAGGTLDTVNPKAAERAERITGLLQGISDIRWTPDKFAFDSLAKKILYGSLYAYKRFALNSWISLMGTVKNINSREARLIGAAQMGNFLAYHTAAAYVTKPFWEWAAKQIVNALDGDDDEEDEEKRVSTGSEVLWNAGWDVLIGSPMPAAVDQLLRWVAVNNGFTKDMWKDPYEDFDQYLDSPLYAPTQPEKMYESLLGPGFKEPTEATIDGLKVLLMQSEADMYEDTEEDIAKRGFKTDQWFTTTAADIAGSFIALPFRGDVKKLMKEIAKERKNRYHKAEKANKGGRVTGDGTEIDSTDYQEQQYNDFVNDPDFYNDEP